MNWFKLAVWRDSISTSEENRWVPLKRKGQITPFGERREIRYGSTGIRERVKVFSIGIRRILPGNEGQHRQMRGRQEKEVEGYLINSLSLKKSEICLRLFQERLVTNT
jgi:hypothetical protein